MLYVCYRCGEIQLKKIAERNESFCRFEKTRPAKPQPRLYVKDEARSLADGPVGVWADEDDEDNKWTVSPGLLTLRRRHTRGPLIRFTTINATRRPHSSSADDDDAAKPSPPFPWCTARAPSRDTGCINLMTAALRARRPDCGAARGRSALSAFSRSAFHSSDAHLPPRSVRFIRPVVCRCRRVATFAHQSD